MEIERCVREHGMRGVKLHPWLQGFSAHEPGLQHVCEAAGALGIPILFHDGTPPFSTPLQLAVLARRHPETQIVLGHGGLHDLWREAIAAVLSAPNVHLCMSGTPGYAMRAIVARCPLERLLFGTDAGLRPEPLQRYAVLRVRQLDELGLDEEQREAILVTNPRRLLAA
jgi:predicted TIM-barrel fold metal-dependent hydrolase